MDTTQSGHRALRSGRVSIPGQIYLVTAVVKDRAPVFRCWEAAHAACRVLHRGTLDARLLAWVLMPDHFHGLVELGEAGNLSRAMRAMKGRIAVEANRQLRRSGPLWQPAFHDHAMRREEDLKRVARYVVENPLRGGLVSSVGDYPFWNAAWEWEW